MEGVLNKHRGALFNAFSKQFVELKNDLKKEEDERRKKEEAEKQKLEERIIELEGLVCGKCTPLSIPITERPTKNIETVDHGTEAREDEPSFSLREFEDKIATLNDTILSLQTELGKVRAENEALREGSRKAPTVDAETTTDGPEEPSKPMTSNAEAQTNDPEAPPPADSEDWKSKASTYRERLVTLLTAHKKLQEKHDEAKSKWTQWISRDEQQRDLITKFQNELRRLRESRGLSVEEHGLLAPLPGSSGPPPITPSKPPQPRDPLGSSPPPAMAALTPARVKPEPTSPSLLNHPLEIADSDADSDLTDSPPSPAPPPLTRNPRLPTANDAKIITIKSEPSTQSIFRGNTGIQDYSELDLDDIGAKAPTPRVVRSVDPDEARARAEALAEELSLGVDVEEEMVEALEDVESGGEELHRRLFSPTRPARPATESQMEEEDIRMELLGRLRERGIEREDFTPVRPMHLGLPTPAMSTPAVETPARPVQRRLLEEPTLPSPAPVRSPARPTRNPLQDSALTPTDASFLNALTPPTTRHFRKIHPAKAPISIKQEPPSPAPLPAPHTAPPRPPPTINSLNILFDDDFIPYQSLKQEPPSPAPLSAPHTAPARTRRPMDPIDPNTVTPLPRQRVQATTEPRKASTRSAKPKKGPTRINDHELQEFGEGGEASDEDVGRKVPKSKAKKQLDLRNMLDTSPPRRPDLRGTSRKRSERSPVSRDGKKRKSDILPPTTPPPVKGKKRKSEGDKVRPLSPSNIRVNPLLNGGVDFAHKQTIRGAARKCLPSCTKPCCKSVGHFASLAGVPLPKRAGPRFRSSSAPPEEEPAEDEEEDKRRKFLDAYGKHREIGMPRGTPPGFWRSDFPGTQELRRDRERAEEEKRGRGRELERGVRGGWYVRKD